MSDDKEIRFLQELKKNNEAIEEICGVKTVEYLSDLVISKDLKNKFGYNSKGSVTYQTKKLREQGLIKEIEEISAKKGSGKSRSKVFVLTDKGIKRLEKFELSTQGDEKQAKIDEFEGDRQGGPAEDLIEVLDMHSDFCYKYNVEKFPDDDIIRWPAERTEEKENGTVIKRKTIERDGNKAVLERFEGKENKTITLKPKLMVNNVYELIRRVERLAWTWYENFKSMGYTISRPTFQGRGKISTIIKNADDLERPINSKFAHTDSTPVKNTLHPDMDSIEENAEFIEVFADITGHVVKLTNEHRDNKKSINQMKQELKELKQGYRQMYELLKTYIESQTDVMSEEFNQEVQSEGGMIYG